MTKVWTIYEFASKLTWLGVIAIEIASKEFKVAPNRLLAQPTK